MSAPQITNRQLIKLLKTYWQWRWLWCATTLLFGGLGFAYVTTVKEDTWTASQGLIIRDEAHGAVMRLGRFSSQTEMKAAQETVLEMARNPQVLHSALATVGRGEPGFFDFDPPTGPPTQAEVEALADGGIEVRAPRGAELGTTEVIYLDITDSDPERARRLNTAVCDELEKHMQEVRKVRADGVIAELETAAVSARESLKESTEKLKSIEAASGADLADLRGLTETVGSGSANRATLDAIETDLRTVDSERFKATEQLKLVSNAFKDPTKLQAAPAQLLAGNPGLQKLGEGLSIASIKARELEGRYTDQHPIVKAAQNTELMIRKQLQDELRVAVANLEQSVTLAEQRIQQLEKEKAQLERRLESVATVRADYSNIAAEVRARSEQVQLADRELAGAIASRDAAMTSSLMTRLDQPLVGEHPEGPGKTAIIAAACGAGLFFGAGLVFLLSPIEAGGGGFGRRASDAGIGRRASDQIRVAGQPGFERRGDGFNRRASDLGGNLAGPPDAGGRQPADVAAASPVTPDAPEMPDTTDAIAARTDSTVTSISAQVDRAHQIEQTTQVKRVAQERKPTQPAANPLSAAAQFPPANAPVPAASPLPRPAANPAPAAKPMGTPKVATSTDSAVQSTAWQTAPTRPRGELSFADHANTIQSVPKSTDRPEHGGEKAATNRSEKSTESKQRPAGPIDIGSLPETASGIPSTS
ncbi:MAG TPA: hypothetical protein DDW52_30055 [Planctomycetaceae bacterium]|nr:hypothetical protein [Planctomycetaceae bacterium]